MNPATADLPLRDIHLPATLTWWPPAPGWWLLAGLCLLIGLLLLWWKKRPATLRLQREARAEFKQIVQDYEQRHDGPQCLRKLNALLRRITLSYCPRERVAGLTGPAWIEQLHSLSRTPVFDHEAQELLTRASYRAAPPGDLAPLFKQVEDWIAQLPRRVEAVQMNEARSC